MAEAHKVDVIISAVDRASAPMKRISGGFNLLSRQGMMAGAMFAGVTMGLQTVMQGFQQLHQWLGDSVQKFRDFERTMSEVATMLDTIGMKILPNMTDEIRFMSINFGKSVNDLGRGLYQVLSAGVDASDAMMVLRNSAKLATATLTNVETAVDAVTTVLNAYGMSAYRSEEITNIFAATIIEGKVRMEELAAAIGYVVPIAAQAGIGFNEVAAAIATLSKQGINAQKASRGLRQVFTQLINPSEEAVGAMVDMGIAYDELIIEGIGLGGVMKMIGEATAGSVTEMSRLIPNTQALSAGLALNAQDGDIFTETLEEINKQLNIVLEMYDKIAATDVFKAEQRKQVGEYVDILVGEKLQDQSEWWDDLSNRIKIAANEIGELFGGDFEWKRAGVVLRDIKEEAKARQDMSNAQSFHNEQVEKWTAILTKSNEAMQISEDFINRTQIAMEKLNNVEIPHLQQLKAISEETHKYKTSLRWLNEALVEGSYSHYLHEGSTRALVGAIRAYKNELDALSMVQRGYNRETSMNSLAAMKIQLTADRRRGRMTRNEKAQLKELGFANTELRIKQTENQLKMNEVQEKLSPAEAELARVRTAYQERIYIIEDTYAREQEMLQEQIDYKYLLLDGYERAIAKHYDEVERLTTLHNRNMQLMQMYGGTGVSMAVEAGMAGKPFPTQGGVIRIEANINVTGNSGIETWAQQIQQAVSAGLISGVETVYG